MEMLFRVPLQRLNHLLLLVQIVGIVQNLLIIVEKVEWWILIVEELGQEVILEDVEEADPIQPLLTLPAHLVPTAIRHIPAKVAPEVHLVVEDVQ